MIDRPVDNPKTCGNCVFSHRAGGPLVGDAAGLECRRYPPTAAPVAGPQGGIGAISVFPPVKSDQTCGEHSTMKGDSYAEKEN